MARILVVDDDADIVALVVRRLQKAGHRVQGAGSAVDALAVIDEKGPPEVAVLDVTLPGMSGLELLGRIREQTGQSDMPAVFLSGLMHADQIAAGRAMGAAYLTKPFVATALLAAVDGVIAEAEAARRGGASNDDDW